MPVGGTLRIGIETGRPEAGSSPPDLSLSFEDLKGQTRIFSFPNDIPSIAQKRGDYLPYIRIIITNEDPRLAGLRDRVLRLRVAAPDCATFGAWQP
jgi:hypothetical protein